MESGFDGAGADEPYRIFNAVSNAPGQAPSPAFGDVDNGESRSFASTDGCIYGGCTGSTHTCRTVSVSACSSGKKDLGRADLTLIDTADAFSRQGASSNSPETMEVTRSAMETMLSWATNDLLASCT